MLCFRYKPDSVYSPDPTDFIGNLVDTVRNKTLK